MLLPEDPLLERRPSHPFVSPEKFLVTLLTESNSPDSQISQKCELLIKMKEQISLYAYNLHKLTYIDSFTFLAVPESEIDSSNTTKSSSSCATFSPTDSTPVHSDQVPSDLSTNYCTFSSFHTHSPHTRTHRKFSGRTCYLPKAHWQTTINGNSNGGLSECQQSSVNKKNINISK